MEMKSPQTVWASVVIVFILVTSATVLVILDKDVSIILTLAALAAVPVLSALGVAVYHKVDQAQEAGNGTLSKFIEMQQKTQDQLTALAMSIPPVSAPSIPPRSPDEEVK